MRPQTKKVLRGLLSLLIIAGVIGAIWPLGQTAYSQWSQRQLHKQWDETAQRTRQPHNAIKPTKVRSSTHPHPKSKIENRKSVWPATRIVIADAGTDAVVLDGWDESTLRQAPGHLPGSALPGQSGNCVIAGHRNVYGSPFYKVDTLLPGSPIELQTPEGSYTYNVLAVFGATDSDQTVLQPPAERGAKPLLTLITCTIPRTSNRVIVTAELQSENL
jgi:sortase A